MLSTLIHLMHRSGHLCNDSHHVEVASRYSVRAIAHPGFNFCRGLAARERRSFVEVWSSGLPLTKVTQAVKYLNLARHDTVWGTRALVNLIGIYINPEDELWFPTAAYSKQVSRHTSDSGPKMRCRHSELRNSALKKCARFFRRQQITAR